MQHILVIKKWDTDKTLSVDLLNWRKKYIAILCMYLFGAKFHHIQWNLLQASIYRIETLIDLSKSLIFGIVSESR